VRVLFSCTAADGHFLPLLPLARAARDAGHTVAVATSASYAEPVGAEGFELLPAGLALAELERRFAPVRHELRTGDLPFDERRVAAFTRRFAAIDAPAKLEELRHAARAWRPDAVVHESCDLAAPVVAAELGVQSIHHSFGRAVPVTALARAAELVAPLWERCGVEPDPLAGAYRGLYVDICPPSLQSPPPARRLQRLRPVTAGPLRREAGRPLVYVTLGTIFNRAERFRLLLDAFAGVDCDVLATVGRSLDPAALGPPPRNARVERYVPQHEILPGASAAVGHGGSGSTLGALAHGVPLLLLPEGADQFENAFACAEAGAAIVLLPGEVDAEALRAALERLLAEPRFAEAARRIADEIATLPAPEEAAAALFAARAQA
jgi:UDP:flavonoid glycosyltransferase YjiC (YdhE family)